MIYFFFQILLVYIHSMYMDNIFTHDRLKKDKDESRRMCFLCKATNYRGKEQITSPSHAR
jgi:hypothetical protein